jgi:hypothetical protein
MKTQELSSKHHRGILVRYTYRGDFNGGAPKYLEIDLVDVKAGGREHLCFAFRCSPG